MQLMPKPIVGNIGGQFLKDSKTVIFHPTPCESLDALIKVMVSGFVSFFYRRFSNKKFKYFSFKGRLCTF